MENSKESKRDAAPLPQNLPLSVDGDGDTGGEVNPLHVIPAEAGIQVGWRVVRTKHKKGYLIAGY